MTENKAWVLAHSLNADMLQMPESGYAVGLTRPDGRYAFLRDSHGAIYPGEAACLDGSRGIPSEWGGWGRGEVWATALATLIGGQVHQQGDVWEILFQRDDGRFAVIGADQVHLYQSRGHYAGCGKPEYLGWDWNV